MWQETLQILGTFFVFVSIRKLTKLIMGCVSCKFNLGRKRKFRALEDDRSESETGGFSETTHRNRDISRPSDTNGTSEGTLNKKSLRSASRPEFKTVNEKINYKKKCNVEEQTTVASKLNESFQNKKRKTTNSHSRTSDMPPQIDLGRKQNLTRKPLTDDASQKKTPLMPNQSETKINRVPPNDCNGNPNKRTEVNQQPHLGLTYGNSSLPSHRNTKQFPKNFNNIQGQSFLTKPEISRKKSGFEHDVENEVPKHLMIDKEPPESTYISENSRSLNQTRYEGKNSNVEDKKHFQTGYRSDDDFRRRKLKGYEQSKNDNVNTNNDESFREYHEKRSDQKNSITQKTYTLGCDCRENSSTAIMKQFGSNSKQDCKEKLFEPQFNFHSNSLLGPDISSSQDKPRQPQTKASKENWQTEKTNISHSMLIKQDRINHTEQYDNENSKVCHLMENHQHKATKSDENLSYEDAALDQIDKEIFSEHRENMGKEAAKYKKYEKTEYKDDFSSRGYDEKSSTQENSIIQKIPTLGDAFGEHLFENSIRHDNKEEKLFEQQFNFNSNSLGGLDIYSLGNKTWQPQSEASKEHQETEKSNIRQPMHIKNDRIDHTEQNKEENVDSCDPMDNHEHKATETDEEFSSAEEASEEPFSEQIKNMEKEAAEYEKDLFEYIAAPNDRKYYYIEESLIRIQIRLDRLDVDHSENLRFKRKNVIKYINKLLRELDQASR